MWAKLFENNNYFLKFYYPKNSNFIGKNKILKLFSIRNSNNGSLSFDMKSCYLKLLMN